MSGAHPGVLFVLLCCCRDGSRRRLRDDLHPTTAPLVPPQSLSRSGPVHRASWSAAPATRRARKPHSEHRAALHNSARHRKRSAGQSTVLFQGARCRPVPCPCAGQGNPVSPCRLQGSSDLQASPIDRHLKGPRPRSCIACCSEPGSGRHHWSGVTPSTRTTGPKART